MTNVCAENYTVGTSVQLSDALNDLPVGKSSEITLTADISFYGEVYVNRGTKITFKLAGHKLNIYGRTRADMLSAISIDDALAGSELNALGGIMANSKGSSVTVTHASDPESAFEIPAGAYEGGTIIIKGNLNARHDTAIQSYDKDSSGKPSSVTVNGNVISADDGYSVRADGGGIIVLHGNLQSKETGAMAGNGGQITIEGNVTCESGIGVIASKASTIVVNGIISAPIAIAIGSSDLIPTSQVMQDGYTVYTRSGDDKSMVKVKIPGIATGLVEKPTGGDFLIFPNPTSGKVQIFDPDNAPINEVVIFNIQGNQVLTIDNFQENNLDLSGLSKGTYLIRLKSQSGLYNQKIVKN